MPRSRAGRWVCSSNARREKGSGGWGGWILAAPSGRGKPRLLLRASASLRETILCSGPRGIERNPRKHLALPGGHLPFQLLEHRGLRGLEIVLLARVRGEVVEELARLRLQVLPVAAAHRLLLAALEDAPVEVARHGTARAGQRGHQVDAVGGRGGGGVRAGQRQE